MLFKSAVNRLVRDGSTPVFCHFARSLCTETALTMAGYLLCVWFTGWTLSLGLDVVSLRFICFMNETYWYAALLVPWVSVSEELVRFYLHRRGNLAGTTQILLMQASLISLACWMVAASYAINLFSGLSLRTAKCDLHTWGCLLTYLREVPSYNWLIPSIGFVLGGTLTCSILIHKHQDHDKVELVGKSYEISAKVLFSLMAAVSFWTLPPFLAVSSFAALALDSFYGVFRTQSIDPLSTVHSVQVDVGIGKDTEKNLIQTHAVRMKEINKYWESGTLTAVTLSLINPGIVSMNKSAEQHDQVLTC